MNKKIGVVGAGNMGRAIAWGMDTLGHDLVVLDQSERALKACQKQIGVHKHRFVCGKSYISLDDCDGVISSLPYHQNYNLAEFCIDNKIAYFDLGGRVDVSDKINNYGRTHAYKPVLTDLGLAPGWVNIIAESMVATISNKQGRIPQSVKMMVGGLPQTPRNTLKYTCTWSYDGLINEYKDNCLILVNGLQDTVKGMEGYEFPISSELGSLEAFYTSGGASHTIASLQKKGVLNCSYKTLRYPGHRELMNFLIHESKLSDDTIIEIFKRTCPPEDDVVVIKVSVDGINFENIVESDEKFSAMQKATAFPIVSAAHTVLTNDFSANVLKYTDIRVEEFNKTLDLIFDKAG